jgi:hypothetical protein
LVDLALELESTIAGHDHGSVVSFAYVWLTKRGRAMLLDFPAPGAPLAAGTEPDALRRPLNAVQCRAFLSRFATVALSGGIGSDPKATRPALSDLGLPLHARTFLKQLGQGLLRDLPAVTLALQDLLGKRTILTRRRRAMHIALSAAVPAAALVAALASAVIQRRLSAGAIVAPLVGALAMMCLLAILSATYFRGGFMFRLLGIALADHNGYEASRHRVLLRAVVAWLPCVCFVGAIGFDSTLAAATAMVVVIAGAALAVVTPGRGLQDRLAGTWLVPR